jgi:uncharacterized membrane protein YhiD involved in acid resistance
MNDLLFYLKEMLRQNASGIDTVRGAMFLYNLVLCAILSSFISFVYVKFGNSVSNRRSFARNFILLSTTTMIVITFVKTSLALSLGLVGALSIIRFRSAIKEPEELAFIFLIMGIGLGCGAGFSTITIIAIIFITGFIIIARFRNPKLDQNLYLSISSRIPNELQIDSIETILQKYCSEVKLKRFDHGKNGIEASYNIVFIDNKQLTNIKNDVLQIDPSAVLTYIDTKRDF